MEISCAKIGKTNISLLGSLGADPLFAAPTQSVEKMDGRIDARLINVIGFGKLANYDNCWTWDTGAGGTREASITLSLAAMLPCFA